MTSAHMEERSSNNAVDQAIAFFEALTPESLRQIPAIYAENARFKDPFNEVEGPEAITRVFEHMFQSLQRPRFVVTGSVVQDFQCFLTWEFRFAFRRFKDGEQVIRGASHLVFSSSGQITIHRDYWDAAEELYEKLPLIDVLMRWLRQRAKR